MLKLVLLHALINVKHYKNKALVLDAQSFV